MKLTNPKLLLTVFALAAGGAYAQTATTAGGCSSGCPSDGGAGVGGNTNTTTLNGGGGLLDAVASITGQDVADVLNKSNTTILDTTTITDTLAHNTLTDTVSNIGNGNDIAAGVLSGSAVNADSVKVHDNSSGSGTAITVTDLVEVKNTGNGNEVANLNLGTVLKKLGGQQPNDVLEVAEGSNSQL